ncbi:DedA family protein [Donghicola sp.]|jgi:membrane protein DedA with SNARE-associated domain|uniref:DedA family protein n=1 Tax=Donghicola sp. TaxID=1929294 RepID=UPI0025DE1B35|nr:DedA family protein [Donghicola sp.]MCT4577321.1 DedA family protein [Donghicola sp.]
MTESFFTLITDYGVWIILASTYLSCLLVPIPSSMMMLAGGALVSVGDLVLWQVVLAAYAGAVLGDQSGFAIGQRSSKLLAQFTSDKPKRKALFTKAQKVVDTSGGIGVFFSTWLFAPLGPWVNIAAGAASMRWLRFTLWDAAGELVWVSIYIGLGYSFATSLSNIAEIASNAIGFVTAALIAFLLGRWLLHRSA